MQGVRVVELGVWVAAPAAAGILCDWGADVVKIESPAGDPARKWVQMLGGDLPVNPPFELDNRGKRGIVLDLSDDNDRSKALELLDAADVFVTNLRMTALTQLGLSPATLLARNEGLIYALITGFGTAGPDADAPTFDIGAWWSRGAIASLLTPPGGDPPFQRGGMGDHTVAMTAAAMICAALYSRHATGRGQLVTTSLLRQAAYTIGFDLNTQLLWGQSIQLGTRTTMANPTANNYVSSDGRRFWLTGIDVERHWPPLARVVGRPEWITSERYGTPLARYQHAVELIAELDAIFATKSLAQWATVFAEEPDLFWTPVNTIEDLLADPQFHAAGGLVEVPDGVSTTTMVATPADFMGTPTAPRSTAPQLGEHTDEILDQLKTATAAMPSVHSDELGVAHD